MILTRIGNKSRIANKIIAFFPPHQIYIEPFFGAGGMFFNKKVVKHNFLNDIDDEIFNLYMVVKNQKEQLKRAILEMPIHASLLKYWQTNFETDPVKKATRFLLLSNFTYLGKGNTLQLMPNNTKIQFFRVLDKTQTLLSDCNFSKLDFRQLLGGAISLRHEDNDIKKSFIYADPPYLGTSASTYKNQNTWEESDVIDLFDTLQNTGVKFAISEFDNSFILAQAKARNLYVQIIGDRYNLKNRRCEILIMNYVLHPTLF